MTGIELQNKVVNVLRKNNSQWYPSGKLVHILFEKFTSNEYNMYKMRVHRALQSLHKIDVIEKRDFGKFEYKFKSC